MPAKKRRLTPDEKRRLNNKDVPLVTKIAAQKAFEEGNIEEAERLLAFLYDPKKYKR